MQLPQLTVRSVPLKVDQALRERAIAEGKSINTVALESLQLGLGLAEEKPLYHDMDSLFGSWQEDEKFDAAIEQFSSIDEELWK